MSSISPDYKLAFDALQVNDVDLLRKLLRESLSLAEKTELLFDGVETDFDSAALLKELVDAGAPLESVDVIWGSTPLSRASGAGKAKTVDALLSLGALVDGLPTAPITGLMSAARTGKVEVASALTHAGADVDRDSLKGPYTALSIAEDPPPNTDGSHARVAEYLRSVGATKPWDFKRPESFWDGVLGELTLLLVEGTLGLTHALPVGSARTSHASIDVRRARHGWKSIFQTLYSAGLTLQGGKHEVGLCLTSKWPLHKRALEEVRFRRPVDFLMAVSDRVLQGATVQHGDVLDREHELVRGLDWPGDFHQWLVVDHQSFVKMRAELADPAVPEVLLLVPHLEKRPLKPGPDARTKADHKASVKWEKPAASGGKNNLVVPLCYDAPWLDGKWY